MKTQNTNDRVTDHAGPALAATTFTPAASPAIGLYDATRILFRALHYLKPRMKGGDLAPPAPMNGEALAGCILHGCISRLVRELQQRGEQKLFEAARPVAG